MSDNDVVKSTIPEVPKNFLAQLRQLGPGMMVAGAFIGTGTLTTAIVAGSKFGYTLLWASVTFAVILVIVLQTMVARLAMASGKTLAQLVRSKLGIWMSIIAVVAIFGGNIVYSVGNVNGIALATEDLPGGFSPVVWITIVTALYWLLLMTGKFHILEKIVSALVVIMGVVFIIDMIISSPDYGQVALGLVVPQFSMSQIVLVTGLIGTTVVPYNLYLHSSAVLERGWHLNPKGFASMARTDTVVPVFLGGIVTMSVGVVAASVLNPKFLEGQVSVSSAADMSAALEPVLGPMAYICFNVGLFAAAVSSMPMAALSASYVTTESFGMSISLKAPGFRTIFTIVAWLPVVIFAVMDSSPITTIIAAQSINGMLLPITAVFILIFVNRKSIMGDLKNTWWLNIFATVAVAFVCVLGAVNIVQALG